MKSFKAESKKLLDVMINSIYTNHEVFLRELISNASDALDKVKLQENACDTPELGIHISFNKESRILTVSDNGIGMNDKALEDCLGTIARSESQSVKEKISTLENSADVDIIGQFGVGFYSAFMVADKVTVVSRAWGEDQAYQWESCGVDGYSITPGHRCAAGTDVILHIRTSTEDENLERYLDQSSLILLIKRYSNYIRYPITMDLAKETFDGERSSLVRDESCIHREVINSMVPLWAVPKDQVSAKEFNEFYRLEFKDNEDPLRVMSLQVRGAIEYNALFFIPSKAPDDLYNKDYPYGPKVYSSNVLIEESMEELIPSHFRFVRGIVDIKNINLNVSRQAIQEDARIQIIARQIEKMISDELKDMAVNDRENYERFFQSYGTGLKFSIVTSRGTLTNVLNTLLLYHSAQEGHLISFDEYLAKEQVTKKTEIYYAAGKDLDHLKKSPSVQAILRQGHDVILCPNSAQDEICLMVMGSYKGANFHSVTSSTLQGSKDTTEHFADHLEVKALEAIKKYSPVPLKDVIISQFLTDPGDVASRVATSGLMTISMARFALSKLDKNEVPDPMFILELNRNHALFKKVSKALEENDQSQIEDLAILFVGQAFLAEDIELRDIQQFNAAVTRLVCQKQPENK